MRDRKIEEHFVGNDRNLARRTDLIESEHFLRLAIIPGGVVGVDDDDGSRTRRDGVFDGVEINLPAEVIDQRIAHESHVMNVREKIEEWIARRRDKNLIARIAECTTSKRICFAGAGGQKNVLKGNLGATLRVVLRDGSAGDF